MIRGGQIVGGIGVAGATPEQGGRIAAAGVAAFSELQE